MDASRLLAVLADVEAETTSLTAALTKLTAAYTAARDTPAQDPTEPIRQARDDVGTLLRGSLTNGYPPSRRRILQAIQGERFVGDTAATYIDAMLAEAAISPAAALAALQTYGTQLSQFRGNCTQARKGLVGLHVEPDALVDEQAEVGILVPRSLTKGHLDALNRQLNRWNIILKGFAELAGADEREVTVRSLSTGSEQIFLETSLTVAGFLAPVIDRVLGWYKQIQEIQKLRKELERLGAPVSEAQGVKAHEKQVIEDSIAGLAKELMARATAVPPGRKGEIQNQLTISIRYITRFVDQGGDVEVTVAPPPPPPGEFVAPADAATMTEAQLEQKKAEWAAVQQQRPEVQERLDLARKGAALASLTNRETGILQLTEAEVAIPEASAEDDDQKEEKRTKK